MKRLSLFVALLCWMGCSQVKAGGLSDLLSEYRGAPQYASQPAFRTVAFRRVVAPVAQPGSQVASPAALQLDTGAALRSTNAQCSNGGCDRR